MYLALLLKMLVKEKEKEGTFILRYILKKNKLETNKENTSYRNKKISYFVTGIRYKLSQLLTV